VHFQPLPLLTVFKEKGYQIEHYPLAFNNYATEISLPIYPQLNNIQCNYIVSSVVQSVQTILNNG
jgi:dTDP-4-amino-4,6-dideoxygalactose transaminase